MSVVLIFLIVLLITWLTTRWLAGYQQNQVRGQNLRIVETLRLTMNSYIQIIEAGDVYLVIAVSKDHVEKLAELTRDQLKLKTDPLDSETFTKETFMKETFTKEAFHDIFDKVKHRFPKK